MKLFQPISDPPDGVWLDPIIGIMYRSGVSKVGEESS